ncbi:glutathione hydrolase-like YwrD proenzyme, partial [Caerostris extrusa]
MEYLNNLVDAAIAPLVHTLKADSIRRVSGMPATYAHPSPLRKTHPSLGHNSPEYIHLVSEATKHAYLESWEFLCDPKCCSGSVQELLTDEFAQNVRDKMDPE